MSTLFKYELRKTMVAKLLLLGITLGFEGLFVYGMLANKQNISIFGATVMLILAFIGTIFVGIYSVSVLHHDMNTKQSYMLFMTPNSCYRILGAKALEAILTVIVMALVFFGLCYTNFTQLIKQFDNVTEAMDLLKQLKEMIFADLDLSTVNVIAFVIRLAATWFEVIMLAFLGDVLATALLKGKKFGGLVAFLFFLALTSISNQLVGLLPNGSSYLIDMIIEAVFLVAVSAVVYAATATVMEKKLSV